MLPRLVDWTSPGRNIDPDLTTQIATLDRRMLDWIVGLDTEINEVVEGANLYTPTCTMDDVVLPDDQKAKITQAVASFQAFKTYRKQRELGAATPHSNAGAAAARSAHNTPVGLVLLFSGASGTGKTLTVNAIARMLDKRVLLVNFNIMVHSEKGNNASVLQSLFREANMHDAVVFFDECESLFAQRSRGGNAQLTELLTEIERHDGMIFLATNRPFDLDEAMHRRITAAFEFRSPHWMQRAAIWRLHVARDGLVLADGIDWRDIALRYDLAGGFIKNALTSALLNAISRDGPEHPTITREDIEHGCALQMRGTLSMKSFSNRVVPSSGLGDLVLTDAIREQLQAVINLEKARAILMNQYVLAAPWHTLPCPRGLSTPSNGEPTPSSAVCLAGGGLTSACATSSRPRCCCGAPPARASPPPPRRSRLRSAGRSRWSATAS